MDVFELTRNLNITSAYSHNEDDRHNAYDNNNGNDHRERYDDINKDIKSNYESR